MPDQSNRPAKEAALEVDLLVVAVGDCIVVYYTKTDNPGMREDCRGWQRLR